MRSSVVDNKINYIRETFTKEDDILLRIKDEAKATNRPININPEDGKLLELLIKMSNTKTILEIGTFLGYSTIWLARSINDDGFIYTIEKDETSYTKAKQNFIEAGVDRKIKILEGTAENILPQLTVQFDMIFIDAEKNHYLDYLNYCEKLLKKGGILVADNTLLSGAVYSDELPYRIRKSTKDNMIKFNKILANNDKYTSILIPAEDGITISIKNF